MERTDLVAMAAGSPRPNAAIGAELAALRIDDAAPLAAAVRLVCELLTKQPYTSTRIELGPGAWRERVLGDPSRAPGPIGGSWLKDFDVVMECVLELYEADHGVTREALESLTREEPRVPYLSLLLQYALFELESFPPAHAHVNRHLAPALKSMLSREGGFIAWLEAKRAAGVRLRELAGMTYTVLGMYDWLLSSRETGHRRYPRSADAWIDLGGGFATPDLARLFRAPLVSFDLEPPTRAREIGIGRFRVSRRKKRWSALPHLDARWQTDEEAAAYLAALDRQAWQRFDVFTDGFDRAQRSYFVTSFGFMTSTVASHSPHAPTRHDLGSNVLAQMATTRAAAERVLELVATGKDVSLVTYQRATSRSYLNLVVFLRFSRHRLVDHALVSRPFQHHGFGVGPPATAGRSSSGSRS